MLARCWPGAVDFDGLWQCATMAVCPALAPSPHLVLPCPCHAAWLPHPLLLSAAFHTGPCLSPYPQVVDIGTLYLGDFTQHLGAEGSRSIRDFKKVYTADEQPPPVTPRADLPSDDISVELQQPGTPPPPAAAAVAEELSSASSSTAVSTAGGGVQRRRSSIEGHGDVQAATDVAAAAGMGELAAKVGV